MTSPQPSDHVVCVKQVIFCTDWQSFIFLCSSLFWSPTGFHFGSPLICICCKLHANSWAHLGLMCLRSSLLCRQYATTQYTRHHNRIYVQSGRKDVQFYFWNGIIEFIVFTSSPPSTNFLCWNPISLLICTCLKLCSCFFYSS